MKQLIFLAIYLAVFNTKLVAALVRFNESSVDDSVQLAENLSTEYVGFLKTGVETTSLRKISKALNIGHLQKSILTKSLENLKNIEQFAVCTLCRAGMNIFMRTINAPESPMTGPARDEYAKHIFMELCKRFDLHIEEVCSGIFDLNWPIFDYIFNNTVADSRSFCGTLPYHICRVKQPEFEFSLKIDPNGPTVNGSKTDLPPRSDDELRILHLTDIHYDPEYRAGSWAECPQPLCCRRQAPANTSKDDLAGYWSDYRSCDTPWYLITNALEHIGKAHKIDFIYHTGDVPPHNVWETTLEGNKQMLTDIHDLIVSQFPNTQVYSCLGNHEAQPTNTFGPVDLPGHLSASWLYEHVWGLWSKWLPLDTKDTILKGGYYTVVPSKGHRIVALNSMDCYLNNWWVFLNGSIALEQLNWLHDTLLQAEKDHEYVHILTHIPTGDSDCWTVWAREYNRLLKRFSHIITGIFNGHTHRDELNVHYTSEGYAVGVSWNGGSLTTFSDTNPNYKIYDVDRETWQVLDYHTWIINLTAANAAGAEVAPFWFEDYTFSETFTNDTSPAGVDQLLNRMANETELLRKFWRYKFTSADSTLAVGCDDDCLKSTICRLATTNIYDKQRCRELQTLLTENLNPRRRERQLG